MDIVGRIRPGECVTQLGAAPYWYQVHLPDGTEDWAAKASLRVAVAAPAEAPDFSNLRIHFIDVGNGDAILIDDRDREVLIDGGDSTGILWEYAKELIQDPIELLVVTHADTDHWCGSSQTPTSRDQVLLVVWRITSIPGKDFA